MRTRWFWVALIAAVLTVYKDLAAEMGLWAPITVTKVRFFSLNLISLGPLFVAIVVQYRRTPEGIERQQFKPVAFGNGIWIAFFAAGVLTHTVVRPLYAAEAAREWLTLVEWACYSVAWMGLPVGLLVGLSRYRLYDADAAISRSVAYLAMTLGLLVLFGVIRGIVDAIGAFYFGRDLGGGQAVWSAVLSALVLRPLHGRLMTWTNRRIRGGLVDLKDDLPPLIGDLRETETTAVVAHTVLEAVEKGVHAQRSAIVFGGEILSARNIDAPGVQAWVSSRPPLVASSAKLERDRKDAVFPIRVPLKAEGATGWLLVGPRPDNSVPSADEREVLGKIAKPVALSVGIARTRQTLADAQRQTLEALQQSVAGLESRLQRLEPESAPRGAA